MQVDPSPMNVGDGGTVSKESSSLTQLSESMVGNPQQTLPPELRGDVPHGQQNKLRTSTDCKMPGVCSDASKSSKTSNSNHCPEVPSSQLCNKPPVFSTDSFSTHLQDRLEVPKAQAEGGAACPNQHWPCGKKVGSEDLMSLVHNNVTQNKKAPQSTGPTQPVISRSQGFQCSTFKAGQPVAFLPSANFASSLCKITLPPGLGQIAALREATATQFQKDSPVPCSGSSMTPRLKTFPYQFSVGRGVTEKKPLSSASKGRCDHGSNAKGCKGAGEHKSTISSSVSHTIALPAQQATQASAPLTHYTISPTAAICCSSALANITTQSRLLSLVEKCPPYRAIEKNSVSYLKPKSVSSTEEHNALCPPEARDVPLDLSSKSKRQKSIKDGQNSPAATTDQCLFEPIQKNSHPSKRPQTSSFSSVSNYALLPDTQRNGSAQRSTSKLSNHNLEPSASWDKSSSQGSLNNLPGTYVGVASPILASTLRSKDGKNAAFVEDVQIFAKQETISIIDQGEQLASRCKKTPFTVKSDGQNKGSTSASTTTPAEQEISSSPLFTSTNSQSSRTSGGKAGIPYTPPGKPLWHQPLFQGMSLQKRSSQNQEPSKVIDSLSCDGPLFHKCELTHTNVKKGKMEKTHSPLSNLESIVKQKALETTALTGETYCNLSSMGSRKPEVVNLPSRSQNPPVQQTVATGFTPCVTSELQDTKTGSNSLFTDATVVNRPEATIVFVPKEKCHDKKEKQTENFTGQKTELSTPKKRCASSNKAGKKDSMLAPNPEERTRENPAVQSELAPNSNLESISFPQHQITTEAEGEKKINGGKNCSVSKGKLPVTKQRKARKKEKTSAETLKKAAILKKKPRKKESSTVVQAPNSKKGISSIAEESPLKQGPLKQSPLKEKPCPGPEGGAKIRKGKCPKVKIAQHPGGKPDIENSPARTMQVDPAFLTKTDQPCKKSNLQQVSSPRPKRGRRRTDDALLRDWSFASPPTPSPPLESPSSLLLPSLVFPLRRPRGRPRLNPLPEGADTDSIKPAQVAGREDQASVKKRKRCRNRKYQNGEYVTDKEKEANRENERIVDEDNEETDVDPPFTSTLPCEGFNPDISPKKSLNTRSGVTRLQESPSTADFNDKPPGKRKFKSKHLCDAEEQKKQKIKRGLAGKRSTGLSTDEDSPMAKKTSTTFVAPKESSSPFPKKKGPGKVGITESTPIRPVPPEVRRLIVNKNAGETLLQRAARLGYQEVVRYCLEKDVREVNRRDNAGYTALHEACARGWTHIVQVLLKHGADVNCSAQDGTRPIHDAVAADSLAAVWMLLNHGADPTLATYSGQTAVKLAQSPSMKTFLKEYFTDLEGRHDQDPSRQWDFYSSSVFETDQKACWDFLLSQPEEEDNEEWRDQGKEKDMDCLLFEFSSEPLLPCYHVQVSLTQGFCNWFLLMDVLKRLKVSARIFRARYPQFEVVILTRAELWRQVSISQTCTAPDELRPVDEEEDEETVELVRCIPELQGLLGSSIQLLQEDDDDDEQSEDRDSDSDLCNR
ncbi:BCL-6 corepressor-like protein 1 isoform X2 [Tachysurus fulvidraco]|nr:BCL-6 corepressor-like protein 1 isoform X2 [Tachysurus fulvidraco]XP_047658254.1 BCL-6 corepressor-like protein 1 isoform X2 [Tachysurus fulvidraco]XP_047658255.1 BCL-6 corepressor-like protein 1 isoform X2 [Tachysurus fulvidraco]XP_047658256.1 BCL-6 corepressor-like protein 1 isoform X2 [Tachysurus fulvidraco]